jgi:hypothetical protein
MDGFVLLGTEFAIAKEMPQDAFGLEQVVGIKAAVFG